MPRKALDAITTPDFLVANKTVIRGHLKPLHCKGSGVQIRVGPVYRSCMAERTDIESIAPRGEHWIRVAEDGGVWRFKEGVDFPEGDRHRFQAAAYAYGNNRGFVVRTKTEGDELLVQFVSPNDRYPNATPRRKALRKVVKRA